MTQNRLGQPAVTARAAPGWQLDTLVSPPALLGANGMRWGPDGRLYIAQAFGSQISAVDVASGDAAVFASGGSGLRAPDDLAFDSHGNLFVTEVMSARVCAFRPNGSRDVIAADVPVANGVTVHGDRIFMSEFNPSGRIWELYADGATPRLIADGLMMPNALCLGPDGLLYFPLVPLGEIWRVSPDGGTPERVAGGLDIPTAVKFDNTGRLVVVESGSGAVSVWDIAAARRVPLAQVAYGIDNFAFAPDGTLYVSHFTDGSVVEISATGDSRTVIAGGMTGPFGIDVDANGALLVADGMSIARISCRGTVERPAMLLQHGFPGYVRGLIVLPDGTWAVSNSAGQIARYSPGTDAQILAEGLDGVMGVARGMEGSLLACESGTGRVIAIAPDGAMRTLAQGLEAPSGLCQLADGSLIVAEAGAGRLVHVAHDGQTPFAEGMICPHGVAATDTGIFVLDRGSRTLFAIAHDHRDKIAVAADLPTGTDAAALPVLPGIKDLMPGPLSPFSDITALPDGRIAFGGDADGSVLILGKETAQHAR